MKLQSSRISLLPIIKSDQDWLHSLFSDPEVGRFLWDDQPVPESQVSEIIQRNHLFFEAGYRLTAVLHN